VQATVWAVAGKAREQAERLTTRARREGDNAGSLFERLRPGIIGGAGELRLQPALNLADYRIRLQ